MELMIKRAPHVRSDEERMYVTCAEVAVEVLLCRKWSVALLCSMRSGPIRIGQLSRIIPGASKKVLVQSLRKLEVEGIVIRRDMSDVVLHVEYQINSQIRESIFVLLDSLSRWGASHLRAQDAVKPSTIS